MRIVVDIYDVKMEHIARLECPFEYEELVESLQYNGYTTQVIAIDQGKESVVNTIIAK